MDKLVATESRLPFEALYAQHYLEILRFCFRKTRNREDAEELANETFAKAYLYEATYDPARGEIRPWLFKIAHHLCIDFIRSRAYRNRQLSETLSELSAIDEDLDKRPIYLVIEACIKRLGDLADFVELYYYHGFTLSEIAQIFGYSALNSVAKKLQKAKALLKKCFESHDLDASSLP